jgi:hypothetical protein
MVATCLQINRKQINRTYYESDFKSIKLANLDLKGLSHEIDFKSFD